MPGKKKLIVQIRLFQTKMLCGPLQNALWPHRLKTTDLKHWMTCTFLKLNESKTKVIEILSNRNIESRIISYIQIDDSCSLPMPNDFVKILGVIFDDRLNLEKHINRVVSTC